MRKPAPHWLTFTVLALLALLGCNVKDKAEKPLKSGALSPPWDSAHFTAKVLEGFHYAGPESLFSVFTHIARIDSLAGDRNAWKIDPDGVDTLNIGQLFDTGFVFPAQPEASMAYAYDDSFRDDTLFRNAFGNGLFTQDHPCATTYVLSGQFLHPARWLRAGMKEREIIEAVGKPRTQIPGVLGYLSRRIGPRADSLKGVSEYEAYDIYEGVNFYFLQDSLFAAVLQSSRPCH